MRAFLELLQPVHRRLFGGQQISHSASAHFQAAKNASECPTLDQLLTSRAGEVQQYGLECPFCREWLPVNQNRCPLCGARYGTRPGMRGSPTQRLAALLILTVLGSISLAAVSGATVAIIAFASGCFLGGANFIEERRRYWWRRY